MKTRRRAADGVVGAAVASPENRSGKKSDRLSMSEIAADGMAGLVDTSLKMSGKLLLKSRGWSVVVYPEQLLGS